MGRVIACYTKKEADPQRIRVFGSAMNRQIIRVTAPQVEASRQQACDFACLFLFSNGDVPP